MRGDASGQSLRDQLLVGAASIRPEVRRRALEQLAGPPVPESVAYLREWFFEVHGRSGVSMAGAAPLSYDTIHAWVRAMDIRPAPTDDEIAALMMLDSAYTMASQPAHTPPPPPTDEPPHGHRRR